MNTTASVEDFFDGSFNDIITMIIAAIYAGVMAWRAERGKRTARFVSDISYGVSLYPLVLLALCCVSSRGVQSLLLSNKVLLSLAGIMALAVTLKRTFDDR